MVRFRGGFVSGQTGDRLEKPETKSRESYESRKHGGTRKKKVEILTFPCDS